MTAPPSPTDFAHAWYLTGPTAGGKSGVALHLAKSIGGEIVSMDSMALYRGLDIGTAKPSALERRQLPHHLIDILEPEGTFSLAQYLEAAREAVAAIRQSGARPLFVGGTPLYLKALLRGIFEGPPADWDFRASLKQQAATQPAGWLHEQLAQADPATAKRLHPRDERRIVRALEVHAKTGMPISHWQRQFDIGRPAEQCRVFVLDWPREQLNQRIDRRVDQMFDQGLVEEVRRLLDQGRRLQRTAAQAVGYREVLEHLAGERDLPATIALVKTRTRQFAKRQRTWFRSLSECRFIPVSEPFDPAEVAERIHLDAANIECERKP